MGQINTDAPASRIDKKSSPENCIFFCEITFIYFNFNAVLSKCMPHCSFGLKLLHGYINWYLFKTPVTVVISFYTPTVVPVAAAVIVANSSNRS